MTLLKTKVLSLKFKALMVLFWLDLITSFKTVMYIHCAIVSFFLFFFKESKKQNVRHDESD